MGGRSDWQAQGSILRPSARPGPEWRLTEGSQLEKAMSLRSPGKGQDTGGGKPLTKPFRFPLRARTPNVTLVSLYPTFIQQTLSTYTQYTPDD